GSRRVPAFGLKSGDEKECSDKAAGTPGCDWGVCCGGGCGGRGRLAANGNERADLIEPTLTVRAENAVVADFDATGRQDMLEEPPKELDGRNRRALQLLAT